MDFVWLLKCVIEKPYAAECWPVAIFESQELAQRAADFINSLSHLAYRYSYDEEFEGLEGDQGWDTVVISAERIDPLFRNSIWRGDEMPYRIQKFEIKK